jgi:hypothetical protein
MTNSAVAPLLIAQMANLGMCQLMQSTVWPATSATNQLDWTLVLDSESSALSMDCITQQPTTTRSTHSSSHALRPD